MNSKQLGVLGEKIAENYLRNKGYQILDKNYSVKFFSGPKRGEIDMVAKKDGIISFVEVKTLRNPATLIAPEEKVDFEKQRKLMKTAESWLMKKKIHFNTRWQIDIISVKVNLNSKKAKVKHFQNV